MQKILLSSKLRSFVWALASCLALASLPLSAAAAGLGKITVFSALGQPLRAAVELSATREELAGMKAQMASPDTFRLAGLDYVTPLSGIRFFIDKRDNGPPLIQLSSDKPIIDPFIDLLLELHWISGRLVRKYTFLLDPPELAGRAARAEPPDGNQYFEPNRATAEPMASSAMDELPPARGESRQPMRGSTGYPVRPGETLGKIASALKPEGISLEQMLVGLFRANPDAFDGHINRLKVGKVLSVPERADLESTSPGEARKLVLSLSSDGSDYRRPPASAVARAVPAKRAEASPPPQEQALREAHDRVAELEKNVADLQKLVELNNQSLAALQKQLAAQRPPVEPAPEALPAAEKPIETSTANQPEANPVEVAQALPEEIAPPAPATAAEDPHFLGLPTDRLWLFLASGAAILALLAVFLLIKRRRQGAQKDGLPPTVRSALLARSSLAAKSTLLLQGGGSAPNSVFQSKGGQSIDTANVPPPSDFSQTGPGSIDSDEVDPVAEADVYMAYGRDVQAEEILLEARQKDPKRPAIHLRLLSIYAKRDDVKQFEALAAELYAETRGVGTRWEKAATMGFKLNPNNPLFGGGNRVLEPEAAAQPPPNSLSLESAEPVPSSKAEAGLQAAPPEVPVALVLAAAPSVALKPAEAIQAVLPEAALETEPLEFDFGDRLPLVAALPLPTPTPTPETFGVATNVLHFNLPDAPPAAETAAVAQAAKLQNGADLDFDLVFDVKMTESTVLGQAMQPRSLMTPSSPTSLDLDHFAVAGLSMPEERMGEAAQVSDFGPLALAPAPLETAEKSEGAQNPPDSPPLAQIEPVAEVEMLFNEQVATKLDLANAYKEMGDLEGARGLLQEVLQEGDAAQQERAQAILARIDL